MALTYNQGWHNGCGMYENAYPSESNFGDLDMADGVILTVDLTFKCRTRL